MFALAFLAVAREGLELAIFLTASVLATDALPTLLGALLGLAGAAFLGYLLFATTCRLSLKQFFRITNVLLILFAAGLVAHAVHEFNEAALIAPVIEQVWDVNPVLDENSQAGQVLKALFGYNGNPSLSEVLAYSGYLIFLWLLFDRPRCPPLAYHQSCAVMLSAFHVTARKTTIPGMNANQPRRPLMRLNA